MLDALLAVVRGGRIEPIEHIHLPEGRKAVVTLLPDEDEASFWLNASRPSADRVWDNREDDVYAKLLEE